MGAMSDMGTVLVPSTTSAGSDGVACGLDSGVLDKVVRLPDGSGSDGRRRVGAGGQAGMPATPHRDELSTTRQGS